MPTTSNKQLAESKEQELANDSKTFHNLPPELIEDILGFLPLPLKDKLQPRTLSKYFQTHFLNTLNTVNPQGISSGSEDSGSIAVPDTDTEVMLNTVSTELANVPVLQCRWHHTLVLIKDKNGTGKLYAWGANTWGQRGLGHNNRVHIPELVNLDAIGTVISMVAEGWHSLALIRDASGKAKLFVWGYNGYGQLGLGHTNPVHTPELVNVDAIGTVISMVAGGWHSLALIRDASGKAKLFVWGYNGYGQLGLGHTNPVHTPELVNVDAIGTVISMIAGGAHSLALIRTDSGEAKLFVWGYNGYGQLGLGHRNDVHTPELVSLDAIGTVISMVAGGAHSLALIRTDSGESKLFAWGRNDFGQLGLGHTNPVHTPELVNVDAIGTVISMIAGALHSFAFIRDVSGKSKLFAWGNNDFGQLGLGHTNPVHTPELVNVDAIGTVISMVAGGWHSLALIRNENGESKLFAWGYNKYGQLGLGHNNNVHTPELVNVDARGTVISMAAGGDHSFVLVRDAENQVLIYTFGDNRYGQLGMGPAEYRRTAFLKACKNKNTNTHVKAKAFEEALITRGAVPAIKSLATPTTILLPEPSLLNAYLISKTESFKALPLNIREVATSAVLKAYQENKPI